jgi:hypothetical protein
MLEFSNVQTIYHLYGGEAIACRRGQTRSDGDLMLAEVLLKAEAPLGERG